MPSGWPQRLDAHTRQLLAGAEDRNPRREPCSFHDAQVLRAGRACRISWRPSAARPDSTLGKIGCPPPLEVARVDSPFGCQAINDAARELIAASPARRVILVARGLERTLELLRQCVEQVIGSLAEGLARSQFRSRVERSEMEQLTQATIVTGLREAPTSELERNLLERLVGSAFMPRADGSIFVLKLGPPRSRCATRTRTRTGPQRIQQLAPFLGHANPSTDLPTLFGPSAQVLFCEGCGKEAVRDGVLQSRDQQRHS